MEIDEIGIDEIELEREPTSRVDKTRLEWDVVTLGETMLRLTPPGLKRILQATNLDIEVGGSESNTAVGLACLGLRVAWLSRLTENPLGRLISQTLKGLGVDTSQVIWTPEDRVGLYFLEEGKAPRSSRVVYDRANSAFSRVVSANLPEEIFQTGKARHLHLTGITPALGPGPAGFARRALELAREAGWKTSFDLNYRSKLWTAGEAQKTCNEFALKADLIIAPLGDARLLYGFSPRLSPEQVLELLGQQYPAASVILTLGKEGALGREPDGPASYQPAFQAEEVGRVGGGDAFSAGLLYSYLEQNTQPGWLPQALRWGTAVAALKYATPGDLPVIDRMEAQELVAQTQTGVVQIKR